MTMRRVGLAALAAMAAATWAEDSAMDPAGLNVMEFGAIPDGAADNTAAFQEALDAVGAAGGGTVCVPTGRYAFDGVLTVPKETALRGVYRYAPAHAGIRDKNAEKPEYGTVLLPRAGRGSEEGAPFIMLQSNALLQGVCVYYPDQDPAAPPAPYPYAVAMRGNNPAVTDVELLNPYNAIDASHNQRALIRNVHGQPLHIGVYVDSIYDIGRIENVHWNPWWSMQEGLFQWQMEHGTGFIFGKSDWHYVLNTFCFGYNVGYRFIETERGATNGNFLGIGADDCWTAVVVEQSAPYGLLITNGEFVSFHGPDPTMVRVEAGHTGTVRFNNCAFWGPCNRNAVIDGEGTVGFSDCTFVHWGLQGEDTHSIVAKNGSILVRGCEFKLDKPQVRLEKGVDRAIITENLLAGPERVASSCRGSAIVSNNVGFKPEPEGLVRHGARASRLKR